MLIPNVFQANNGFKLTAQRHKVSYVYQPELLKISMFVHCTSHASHATQNCVAQHKKPDRSIQLKQEFPHEVMQGEKKAIRLDYDIKSLCVC